MFTPHLKKERFSRIAGAASSKQKEAHKLPQVVAARKQVGREYTSRLWFDEVKMGEKVTSVTVAHCSTFRLFVVNIFLP